MSPTLMPALFRGSALRDARDQHAGLEAVDAADGSGQILLEGDADGATHNLVRRPDQIVVDLDTVFDGMAKPMP